MILQIFIVLFMFITAYLFYIFRLESIEKRRKELREKVNIKMKGESHAGQNEKLVGVK